MLVKRRLAPLQVRCLLEATLAGNPASRWPLLVRMFHQYSLLSTKREAPKSSPDQGAAGGGAVGSDALIFVLQGEND